MPWPVACRLLCRSRTLNQSEPSEKVARKLLDVTREVTVELHPHKARGLRVSLSSSLDRDLGLDSLGRVELLMRLERAFRVRLGEELLAEASTPGDLLSAVLAGGEGDVLAAATIAEPLAEGPPVAEPLEAKTLVEALEWHVEHHAERAHLVLYAGEREETISYGGLRARAGAVAAGLRARELGPGCSVAIMLPTGADFFAAFFGALYAGARPVPIYPPFRPSQIEDHLRRQAGILRNAQARVLISSPEARRVAALLRAQVKELRAVETVGELAAGQAAGAGAPCGAEDIALLQYTSGSTGDPKGVVLTHANLLANIRGMGHALEASSSDVFVSWLPLYHDMGLIGAWLGSLYYAAPVVILSPLRFLSRPESWLWAIHRHRATLSAAPNFGYELCVRKIREEDLEGLDLSSWRVAVNGAEPVSPQTLGRFGDRFAPYGFRRNALAPVYGLAESSVGLAFPPLDRGPKVDRIVRPALTGSGRAVPAAPAEPAPLEFVACGRPLIAHELRVVGPDGRELADRHEGRLQFRGPSTTQGYFRNAEKTRELFDGDWLESGDLAYVAEGDVYLTGRTKDLIIRAGRNVYPHELEEAIGDLPGVRKGCVAAFASTDPQSGTERLIVLAETRGRDPRERARLRDEIERVANGLLETPPDDIVVVPPHTVLKTSSGKIRRSACRSLYEEERLGGRPRALWWQLVRLGVSGARPQVARALAHAGALLYAGYWWACVVACGALAWLAVLALPRRSWCWAVVRRAARTVLWLTRTPVALSGAEGLARLQQEGGLLLVNHSSYFDGLVLAAELPGEPAFVAKKELEGQRVAGPLLRRLGTLFVERVDLQHSVEDTQRVLEAARAGRFLVFFPEGTLRRMPGLLPFKLGAFQVAAEAGVPVLPSALLGTRSILRTDQWFPRRGPVELRIGHPLRPQGHDFKATIDLRDRTRTAMLTLSGEPDLAEEEVTI